jgi:hypothetical protein
MFPGGLPSFDGSLVFLDTGPSFFVPCMPPFFGCFDLFMIGRVSSLFLYMKPTIQGNKACILLSDAIYNRALQICKVPPNFLQSSVHK